ncbi:7-deoxyloganetin glucosyltransferase [Ranunculus cassubicifolius]
MASFYVAQKPHVVCVPLPFQGHINAMLKLAKVLHTKGFRITFVNTEFNHQKMLKAMGPDSLEGMPDFGYETIPDGLPPSEISASQDILQLWESLSKTCLLPLCTLISKLNEAASTSGKPLVSCIISDVLLSVTLEAAEMFSIPGVLLWPMSASVLLIYLHAEQILGNVILPLKDKINGYLDEPIKFISDMMEIRLKDLPSFFWDGSEGLHNIVIQNIRKAPTASGIIVNTFDALENESLNALKGLLPPIYTIGPLQLLEQQIPDKQLRSFKSNLLEEHQDCLKWLDSRQTNSVLYVNFGSITVMTTQQLLEFAWGLANSKYPFLWVIRPDLVIGEAAVLPPEFTEETADRGMISGWCPQEQVLCHSSIGGFLTHGGWNSIMDTICGGIPIISWPFFGDQQTNCWSACSHWGIGMEIDNDVKRDKLEALVRELMEGEKGKKMKEKVMEWKKSTEVSAQPDGSSYANLDKIVEELLVAKKLD